VVDGFQVRSFAVLRWVSGHTERSRIGEGGTVRDDPGALDALRRRIEHTRAPLVLADHEGPTDDAAAEARDLGAELVVPLAVAGRLVGAFAVGPRRSGRPFTHADLEVLGTLAAQSAVAIDNARSFGALQELNLALEDRVRERTAELETSYRTLESTQAQLVQSEKMASLGVLVAGVAHEINNPVSFIVNNAAPLEEVLAELREVMARHPEIPVGEALEDATLAARLMAEGAERTARIVADLRAFSRLSDAETGLVDLREGIVVSQRLLRQRWADRIVMHLDLDDLPPVDGASGALNQVFMNLLANACDAVSDTGNVWITGRHEPPWVHVDVRDDGSGIDPAHLSRIFDPFFTTKPQGLGTGLGLAIAHGIVTNHGGRITVTSTPGVGTTMTVTLPVRAAAGAAPAGGQRARSA
jgi:signal transduction histidine kinase